jgi:CheY-like chemotaxis protein
MEPLAPITKRILLIDDDEDLREIFLATFRAIADLEVLLAESGPAGLAIAQTEPLDAILIDVSMPGMDGIEVFHQLQANPTTQAIPAIFMTARTHADDQQYLLQLGSEAVLSKACPPPQLAAQVVEILSKI